MAMYFRRGSFGQKMVFVGGATLALGILLLLVKLVMSLAGLAEAITLAGLLVLMIGLVLSRRSRGRRHEIQDRVPHV